jgi:hypothetical protein
MAGNKTLVMTTVCMEPASLPKQWGPHGMAHGTAVHSWHKHGQNGYSIRITAGPKLGCYLPPHGHTQERTKEESAHACNSHLSRILNVRETAGNALKRYQASFIREEEPGKKRSKNRRGQRGVGTGYDHPQEKGPRRPRSRDIGESAAPPRTKSPHQSPAPKGCASSPALDKPGGTGAKCGIRKSRTTLIRVYDDE